MAKVSVSEMMITVGKDVITFPLWWYSEGLKRTFRFCVEAVRGYRRSLGLSVWMQNLFVPMFGQRDWQSRLISFFMRGVQIIGRSLILVLWSGLMVILFFAYLTLPLMAIAMMLYHGLGGLLTYGG